MAKRSRPIESLVTFRNSQQVSVQGTLVQLNRHMVVFEVYNPYSVVQLSEVLQEMRIKRGERDIYQGRAVVTNLVNTGLMLIVSASLIEPWSDIINLHPGPQLREEVRSFVDDWENNNEELQPEYVLRVGNFRNFLLELKRWLEHGETLAGITEPTVSGDLVQEFVADVDSMTADRFHELFAGFEEAAKQLPKKAVANHRAFAQRELHPVVLVSPFMFRSFTKPLGYAGDYEMVNMMLGEPCRGPNTLAKVLNAAAVRADAPRAHRNRITMLTEYLVEETRRVVENSRSFRALNIGCGPASEVQRMLESSWLSDRADFELVDFNQPTLDYAESQISEAIRANRRDTRVNYRLKSVNDLIKEATGQATYETSTYDVVYCAGLFDYFGDPTCEGLIDLFYQWTAPGGLVMVTNVTPGHSTEYFMSHVLEWNLKLRDEQQMLSLAPKGADVTTKLDETGANVFMLIRKPDAKD